MLVRQSPPNVFYNAAAAAHNVAAAAAQAAHAAAAANAPKTASAKPPASVPPPQPPTVSPPSIVASSNRPRSPGALEGTDTHEADVAAVRAAEAKARLVEANARSEAAAQEAKEAAEAAEVAKIAAAAVVLPLPATREDITRDGRVGRRENAFLDTYFAFFGRFVR